VKFNIPFLHSRKNKYQEIDPDEILLDSSNIPEFDSYQLEGRLEKPIPKITLVVTEIFFALVSAAFLIQAWNLQITNGEIYRERSEKNLLRPVPIFAGRGVIFDRNGVELSWNAPVDFTNKDYLGATSTIAEDVVARRMYAPTAGLAHILGYVQYPTKDNNGFYYREDFEGVDGAEKYFNEDLRGVNGSRLVEVDAKGNIISENVVRPPEPGGNIALSIDSRVQSALYDNIKDLADNTGFEGGAGIIMDTRTGEILAMTSYPEFNPQVISDKADTSAIKAMLNSPDLPFLNRATDGLYTPGSIIKPYLALGVLNEKIIDPLKTINDTGSISIPNPYDPTKFSVFRDWKALGMLDLRHAIAMSSDVYFYTVGGGFGDQKGLGIANIDKYLKLFGFGSDIPSSFVSGKSGTVPTPEWKKQIFNEIWYLGDTYHTAIGQYGMQVTPIQIVRAMAAVANGGDLPIPTVEKGDSPRIESKIRIPAQYFQIVREGMRLGVEIGTSKTLNAPYVSMAGKSGTAELGASKEKVNSWITGFFPYENPHYAFAVVLEKGSVRNQIGATKAMRQQLDWMEVNTPEYFK
jgi:penicillin-binding protein 2